MGEAWPVTMSIFESVFNLKCVMKKVVALVVLGLTVVLSSCSYQTCATYARRPVPQQADVRL